MAAKRLYEGMFLVDSSLAAADWEGTLAIAENILQRADAEVVVMRKWEERRLAYDLDHKTRGTYILCYFKADPQRIAGIEKDVQLSEKVMRVLVLGTEKRPSEMIEQDIAGPAGPEQTHEPVAPEAPAAPSAPAAPDAADAPAQEQAPEARKADEGSEPSAGAEPTEESAGPSAEEQGGTTEEAEPETASETASDDAEKS